MSHCSDGQMWWQQVNFPYQKYFQFVSDNKFPYLFCLIFALRSVQISVGHSSFFNVNVYTSQAQVCVCECSNILVSTVKGFCLDRSEPPNVELSYLALAEAEHILWSTVIGFYFFYITFFPKYTFCQLISIFSFCFFLRIGNCHLYYCSFSIFIF